MKLKKWLRIIGLFCIFVVVLGAVAEYRLAQLNFEVHPLDFGELCPLREQMSFDYIWSGTRASRELVCKERPFRILLIGCSFTYGVGVPQNKTYVWHLQQLLPYCTIDNIAHPGDGAFHALRSEFTILNYQHYDLVLYATIENHLYRETAAEVEVKNCLGEDVACDCAACSAARTSNSCEEQPAPWNGCRFTCVDKSNNMAYFIMVHAWHLPLITRLRCMNYLRSVWQEVYCGWLRVKDSNYLLHRMTALMRMQRIVAEHSGSKYCAINLYGYSDSQRHKIASQQLCPDDNTPPLLFLNAEYPVDYMKCDMHTEPGDDDVGDHPDAIVHHYYAHRIAKLLLDNHLVPPISQEREQCHGASGLAGHLVRQQHSADVDCGFSAKSGN